jgi:molybdate transport system ATP-binding protein
MSQIDVNLVLAQGTFSLKAAFQVPLQGVCAFYGPSGAGKTSLLDVLAGLRRPTFGYVKIGDDLYDDTARNHHVPSHKRLIGYVFQDARLFPHLNVEANLRYGMQRRNRDRRERAPHFTDIVDLLGLHAVLRANPYTLSGGEAQRVAIGRALLCAPELLLLDEPLSALDMGRRHEILAYLQNLKANLRIPMVMVTHHFNDILQLAEHLVLIDQGQVLGYGSLAAMLSQSHANGMLSGSSMAVGTLLDAVVHAHEAQDQATMLRFQGGLLWVPYAPHLPLGTALRVLVEAQDVIIALPGVDRLSVSNQLPATIVDIAALDSAGTAGSKRRGGRVHVRARVGETIFLAEVMAYSAQRLGLHPGMGITLCIKAVRFDEQHLALYDRQIS